MLTILRQIIFKVTIEENQVPGGTKRYVMLSGVDDLAEEVIGNLSIGLDPPGELVLSKAWARMDQLSFDSFPWADSDVPLQRRGVDAGWLIDFLRGLQDDLNWARDVAIEQQKLATSHNQAGMWGVHEQPRMRVPLSIPTPIFLNVHSLVEYFIKPLTKAAKAPFYAFVPEEYRGKPKTFISHTWNSLLIGPEQQPIGSIDALAHGLGNIWIDFACYNQHTFESIPTDMEEVIGEIGRVHFPATFVPTLQRTWCLWELLCADHTGAELDVCVKRGYRNDKKMSTNAFYRSFKGVEKSTSTVAEDQNVIMEEVLRRFQSIKQANEHLDNLIRTRLSHPWAELRARDEDDLGFRPYPWAYEPHGKTETKVKRRDRWPKFEPYIGPVLRGSFVLAPDSYQPEHQRTLDLLISTGVRYQPVLDLLIESGVQVPVNDAAEYERRRASPVFRATALGDADSVTQYLGAGGNPEETMGGGTLVSHAAWGGHVSIVDSLLAAGADIEGGDSEVSPLRIAADRGHVECAQLLLEGGALVDATTLDGWTALLFAASSGHLPVVKLLVEWGADVNVASKSTGASPLIMACLKDHHSTISFLLDRGANLKHADSNGETALHHAADGGHAAIVEELLKSGADEAVVNTAGESPLDMAADKGHAECVQLLLEEGALVDAATPDGWTALLYAAVSGHLPVVRLLVERGADVNVASKSTGASPLIMACLKGHHSTVSFLLDRGADVNHANCEGVTALHRAADGVNAAIVEELLKSGADKAVVNRAGECPFDIAKRGAVFGHDLLEQLKP